MKVSVLGINHKSAPLSLRDKLVFNQDLIAHSMKEFKKKFRSGVVILSTCNRTEIYSSIFNRGKIEEWLAKEHQVSTSTISKHSYFYKENECLNHAAAVGAGLDSMIIGEPQILGQIKQAYRVAENSDLIDKQLIIFFNKVFEFSKTVRNKTQIGTNSTTIASTAFKVIKKIFNNIKNLSIIFVGAGEMNELCAKYFSNHDVKNIMIANRTLSKGTKLAKKINAKGCLIGDLHKIIHQYDVVISCTGSQLPIIGLGMIEEAIKKRKNQPMFLIDLAVPCDIEKEVETIQDIFLYNLEDLARLAQDGMTLRKQELKKAHDLLNKLIINYEKDVTNANTPLTVSLRKLFTEINEKELEKAINKIGNGENPDEVCRTLSRNLTNKFLHFPAKSINKSNEYAKVIKEIFNIKD